MGRLREQRVGGRGGYGAGPPVLAPEVEYGSIKGPPSVISPLNRAGFALDNVEFHELPAARMVADRAATFSGPTRKGDRTVLSQLRSSGGARVLEFKNTSQKSQV